jgi:hypothetical protein
MLVHYALCTLRCRSDTILRLMATRQRLTTQHLTIIWQVTSTVNHTLTILLSAPLQAAVQLILMPLQTEWISHHYWLLRMCTAHCCSQAIICYVLLHRCIPRVFLSCAALHSSSHTCCYTKHLSRLLVAFISWRYSAGCL